MSSLFIMCRATMICGTMNCPECTTEEIDRIYREDLRCLSGKPVILEKDGRQLALVGDVGWYDYSMASPEYSRDVLDGMMMDGRTWHDEICTISGRRTIRSRCSGV